MKITFESSKEWHALMLADQFLKSNRYSRGDMQRGAPMGILKGDYVIGKWRNLSECEKYQLDGRVEAESFRNGPVVVFLKDEKPLEITISTKTLVS